MRSRGNLCVVFFLLLMCLAATLASAQRLVRAPIYSAGSPNADVATGDFNADGNADLAFLSNTNPGVITIRLGIGNGKFNKGQQLTLGGLTHSIISGDWNNDGVVDLAATSSSANTVVVSILLGNGDGTFTLSGSFSTGGVEQALAAGDLNGDGISDLVLTAGEQLSVLLGLRGGNFGSPTFVGTFTFPTYGVAIADLNQDGKLDIVAVDDDEFDGLSHLYTLQGNGDGTFASPKVYDTIYYALDNPVVSDLNHDGIPDVAVPGWEVAVHLGRGDGTLKPETDFQSTPDYAGGTLVASDLNNDGNIDLLMVSDFSSQLAVLLGNGDGTFKGASLFGTGPCPTIAAIADFNKDGKLDSAIPDSCDSNFVELVGDGTGKFTTRRSFAVAPFAQVASVSAGYMDSDANLDLVVLDDSNNHNVVLLPGDKNGAFRVGTSYRTRLGSKWATIGDVNGDGKNDVITADGTNNTVSVFVGNGNGTLQNPTAYATASSPQFVIAADVNGDGKADVFTANPSSNSISVLLTSGSGFLPHVDYTVTSPVQLAFGDINHDGKMDLVVASSSGTGNVFLNNGDGTFTSGAILTVGGKPVSAAIGDVNNDGKPDVVIASSSAALVYTFLGNGDGTFQAARTSAAPTAAKGVMLADFDNDGKLDAVLVGGASQTTAAAAYLPGKGDGTFRQAQLYTTDYVAPALAIGDFNSDGFLDVATANGSAANVSVLLNTAIQ